MESDETASQARPIRQSILGISPSTIAGVIETLESSGVNITDMLNSIAGSSQQNATTIPAGTEPADDALVSASPNGSGGTSAE